VENEIKEGEKKEGGGRRRKREWKGTSGGVNRGPCAITAACACLRTRTARITPATRNHATCSTAWSFHLYPFHLSLTHLSLSSLSLSASPCAGMKEKFNSNRYGTRKTRLKYNYQMIIEGENKGIEHSKRENQKEVREGVKRRERTIIKKPFYST
jgi:hypothetical protein